MARILHWAARLEPTALDIIMHEQRHHTHTHIERDMSRETL